MYSFMDGYAGMESTSSELIGFFFLSGPQISCAFVVLLVTGCGRTDVLALFVLAASVAEFW